MIGGLVSVVIPAFNRESFLAEAVESALRQADVRVEVLVVDDGSTDGTPMVARGFADRIVYLRQGNAGPPAARNRGVRAARGEFLSFLDSDDLWPPDRTRKLAECLAAHPDAGGAMGHLQYVSVEDSRSARFAAVCRETGAVLNYNLGASLFRTERFLSVGLFDESMKLSDDWDWFVRAREKGVEMAILPDVTLINRRHGGNLSNRRAEGDHYTLRMLKRALDRRRSERGGS
jgi:glycosyltransferase involved in cell wall biosynthesis